jgi:hypothetical protein
LGLCVHPYIDQDEVVWAFDIRVNRPLRYCCIFAPESVLHIPVDYYLSVHNSGKIYLQHHHCYYVHTYIHTIYLFFWIAVYLWWHQTKYQDSVAISNLACNLERESELVARTEGMKTVVFATRRREGVVVAPGGVTNKITFCYVSVN